MRSQKDFEAYAFGLVHEHITNKLSIELIPERLREIFGGFYTIVQSPNEGLIYNSCKYHACNFKYGINFYHVWRNK